MKIVFYGYRDWALKIFNSLNSQNYYLITHNDYKILNNIKPDIVFFVGWSDIIPTEIVNNYTCICLHPSPLPKYRGGSPLQHQIINGETNSAVSLFIMDDGLDTGDIVYQKEYSLNGDLKTIFNNIIDVGIIGIKNVIDDYPNFNRVKQNNNNSTSFKRRTPNDSEITIDDILNSDPLKLHNKIRSLNDPYPNAFIRCKNGNKLYLIDTKT
jgi:methionyl-tRNA formyltransferase